MSKLIAEDIADAVKEANEILRLRAEVTALKHDLDSYMKVANEYLAEVERLTAENKQLGDRWNDISYERNDLRAEIERQAARMKVLDDENERLKAESALWESRTKDGAEIIMGNVKEIERLQHDLSLYVREAALLQARNVKLRELLLEWAPDERTRSFGW